MTLGAKMTGSKFKCDISDVYYHMRHVALFTTNNLMECTHRHNMTSMNVL